MTITYVFGTLLTANGAVKQLNIVAVISLLINIILNFILIPKYEVVGAAVATFITQIFMGLAQLILAQYIFKFRVNTPLILRFLALALASGLIGHFIRQINTDLAWLQIVSSGIIMLILGVLFKIIEPKAVLKILKESDYRVQVGEQRIEFGDAVAQALFKEGADFFKTAKLESTYFLQHGNTAVVLPWAGDKVVNTLVAVLIQKGFGAGAFAGIIEVENTLIDHVIGALKSFRDDKTISAIDLADAIAEKTIDKFDEYLPQEILAQGYAARTFDVEKAQVLVKELL